MPYDDKIKQLLQLEQTNALVTLVYMWWMYLEA